MNNSIEERHAQFNTSEEIIFDIVRQATRKIPTKRTKIMKGYASEVYDVETAEGGVFIAKIRHHGTLTYVLEQWALEQCRKVGVPVPQVFGLGKVKVKDEEYEYVVLEKIRGKPIADLKNVLTSEQMNKVLRNAGIVLRKIHSIPAGGFYQRHETGTWDFQTWRAYMDSTVKDRSSEKALILKAGFNETEFDFMTNALIELRDQFSCAEPRLCQGDYLPEHIFVDEDLDITGIIDFGMFEGNHPIHDFAYFSFEVPSLSLQPMIAGYGGHEMFDENFERRLQLHKIALMMGHLSYHVRENMHPETEFVSKRLKETLTQLVQF